MNSKDEISINCTRQQIPSKKAQNTGLQNNELITKSDEKFKVHQNTEI